jgi:hypothetical protein
MHSIGRISIAIRDGDAKPVHWPPFPAIFLDQRTPRCSVPEDQVMRKCWRINPDAGLDYQVERLARRESRSVSNMLFVLIKEALAARARGEQLSAEPQE